MLIKILKRLAQGGLYSNKLMARELGMDEGVVEQMITQLQNLGYIEKDDEEKCSSGCDCGSSKKDSCCGKTDIGVKIWNITEKGKKAISV
ncbi:transcriptional regulator [Clostridium frigoris]|uniref:Transcriptional regulator n=1 Tax=Clostridium frigoris TaxID=205327 RepID=A0ABS6BN57_9CLOT|nr:FeoC-like transcriptional regulator [Clostridium frigoris]MBU3158360.1 transcriptional regulator [Clostridium frigoris]